MHIDVTRHFWPVELSLSFHSLPTSGGIYSWITRGGSKIGGNAHEDEVMGRAVIVSHSLHCDLLSLASISLIRA